MDAKVTWNQAMSFAGSAGSGFSVPLDADPGSGGADSGFRPLELMAAFDVHVNAVQQNTHPHVFTRARILYQVTGHAVDEAAVRRAIALSAQKYCPAQAMLSRAFPMDLVYEIYESGVGLVKQGEWLPE
jgi:putative redox protein